MTGPKCVTCGIRKPTSEFYKRADRKSGLSGSCKECTRERAARWYAENKDRASRSQAQWHARNRERQAHYKRRRQYGITDAEYKRMREEQGDRCAICGKDRPLVVDHCHDTGKVRGLLCNKCNSAIGYLGDDPTVIERAATYVRTPKTSLLATAS